MTILTLEKLNDIINNQYCKYADSLLQDIMLMDRYKKSPATKNYISIITDIQNELGISEKQKRYMFHKLLPIIVPPAVKASIRGQIFNSYIKRLLQKHCTCKVVFEEKHDFVSEIPDWIIYKQNGEVIIGYNQLDLWLGGAQLNRGMKYIMDDRLHNKAKKNNIKIISVVARKIILKNENKISTMIRRGVNTGRLIWVKKLRANIP